MKEILEAALSAYNSSLIPKEYLVEALLENVSLYRDIQLKYKYSMDKISSWVKKEFPNKPKGSNFRNYLLSTQSCKYCSYCKTAKSIKEFGKNISNNDNLSDQCKECFITVYKKWYMENSAVHIQNVQVRIRNLDRALTYEEIQLVFDRDGNKCQVCGLTNEKHLINHGQRLHLDHIHPLSKGGLTTTDNIQLLCRSCNSRKSNTMDT